MAGSLEFIKSASGSSVSSFTVTDIFSADYDVYKIVISQIDVSTSNSSRIRLLDSGGSVISASEYDTANLRLRANASFEELRYTGQTYFQYTFSMEADSSDSGGMVMYVYNPNDSSSYTFIQYQEVTYGTNYLGYKSIGVHKSAETISGLQFTTTGGTYDNLTIKAYGVK